MENKQRLASLDILRGFDLWLLLMFGPIAHTLLRILDNPSLDGISYQLGHVSWEGFAVWDIIMPLFMFMSGITIPFSMAKYKNGVTPGKEFYLKLLKRFAMLFFLGWLVQGHLLDLDWKMFKPYDNTLHSIAVGYVVSAIIFVNCGKRGQIIWTAVPFAIYFLAFTLTGMNLDNQGNIAMLVDKAILGSHRDGVIWEGLNWSYNTNYDYTWILSSLNFIVTTMLGCYAGQIIRNESYKPEKRAWLLALTGASLIASALAISPIFPIIKKIWSSSMTLYAGGISFLLIALTYYIVDVRGWSKGLNWLKYFGMNSIAAYMIGEVINFKPISANLLHGFEHLTGDWYALILAIADTFILFFILRHMYRKKVFLKV